MKKFINKKTIIIADLLAVPVLLLCRWLTSVMLSHESDCTWTLFGGQCVTCGGTHFVQSLSHGRILEAYEHNQFLFILLILLLISWVLLHLYLFFKMEFARKALRIIFSIPSLIVVLTGLFVFLVIRNMPAFIRAWEQIF